MRNIRSTFLLSAAVLVAAFTIACAEDPTPTPTAAPTPTPTPEPFTIEVISAFPASLDTADTLAEFGRIVSDLTEGSVQVVSMGGPEVVHPFEQFVPVREGVFDAGFSVGAYHTDITLLGLADLLAANHKDAGDSFALREQCGLTQALGEVYRPLGVEYLGTMTGGYGARLLTADRYDSTDLGGVTLRAVDVYRPHLLTHGATTVNMPFEEIYVALQNGVLDGVFWGAPGAVTGGWHEIVRYQYPDSFVGGGGPSLYVNAGTWAALSPDEQQAVREAVAATSTYYEEANRELERAEREALLAAGVEEIEWSAEDAARWQTVFAESALTFFILPDATHGPGIADAVRCVNAEVGR